MKIRITTQALAILLAVYAVTGCDRQPVGAASPAPEPSTEPVPAVAVAEPGKTVLELQTSDAKVATTSAGAKADGAISASGSAGILMFGPYVPLGPGKYSLLLQGSSKTPFTVDVATDAGAKTITKMDFANSDSADGSLAKVDFELAQAVEAIEFRVFVQEGSDTKVTSYKVVTR